MSKINHHLRSFKESIITIVKNPLEHLLNLLVLAIIISICLIGLTFNKNLSTWHKTHINYPQITVYLNPKAAANHNNEVVQQLNKFKPKLVASYEFITKEQGLKQISDDKELKQIASEVLSNNNNPLPDIFIVNTNSTDTEVLEQFKMKLGQLPMVDNVDMDINYANKLDELITFVNKASGFIQIFFIFLLCLVIYNQIRLQMLVKSDAILVTRLIGAGDSFIMRPLIDYALVQLTLASIIAITATKYFLVLLNNIIGQFGHLFSNKLIITPLSGIDLALSWVVLSIFTILSVALAVRWVFANNTNT